MGCWHKSVCGIRKKITSAGVCWFVAHSFGPMGQCQRLVWWKFCMQWVVTHATHVFSVTMSDVDSVVSTLSYGASIFNTPWAMCQPGWSDWCLSPAFPDFKTALPVALGLDDLTGEDGIHVLDLSIFLFKTNTFVKLFLCFWPWTKASDRELVHSKKKRQHTAVPCQAQCVFLMTFMCVICMWTCEYACLYMWMQGQSRTSNVFLYCSPPCCLEIRSFIHPEAAHPFG